MEMNRTLSIAVAMMLATAPISAISKVSEEEAAQLGNELTPVGADPSANADGTIPAWDGGLKEAPAGYKPGGPYIDPFADEKPLFVITKANMAEYADKLAIFADFMALFQNHETAQ